MDRQQASVLVPYCIPSRRNDISVDDFLVYHYDELCRVYDEMCKRMLDACDWENFVWFCYTHTDRHKPKDLNVRRKEHFEQYMS